MRPWIWALGGGALAIAALVRLHLGEYALAAVDTFGVVGALFAWRTERAKELEQRARLARLQAELQRLHDAGYEAVLEVRM